MCEVSPNCVYRCKQFFNSRLVWFILLLNYDGFRYVRKDFLALGKFCLNISNIPVTIDLNIPEELYKFIQLFVPQSYYLPMTLENMNNVAFTPK